METICNNPRSPSFFKKHDAKMPYWKRAIDISCCVVAFPILAVGVLLMTAVTKLLSPGPVFFRQERIGFRGQRFRIYKFRTMHVAADTRVHQDYFKQLMETNAPMMKLDARGDSRLIPLGWLLRASGLDELPQIINVFRGEMTLVGPRPCIPSEFEQFLPWQHERFNAFPGLTGLWQVSGKNRTTFEEMIRFDIEYARTLSPFLDLKIIVLTPAALLSQIQDTRSRRKASAPAAMPHPGIAKPRASLSGR